MYENNEIYGQPENGMSAQTANETPARQEYDLNAQPEKEVTKPEYDLSAQPEKETFTQPERNVSVPSENMVQAQPENVTSTQSEIERPMTENAGMAQNNGAVQSTGMAQNTGAAQSSGVTQNNGAAQSIGMTQNNDAVQSAGMTQNVGAAQSIGMTQNTGAAQKNAYATYDIGQTGQRAQAAGVAQNPVWNQEQAPNKGSEQKKKSGFAQKFFLCVSLGLFFGIFAGIGFYAAYQGMGIVRKLETIQESEDGKSEDAIVEETGNAKDKGVIQQTNAQPRPVYAVSNVSEIVEEVMPAMVSITNNYTERTTFWGQVYEEEVSSSGSGIIVSQNDDELLVVTNNHVVEDAEKLMVTLIDGTEVEAKIKGVDSEMDLAVIAIPMKNIKKDTMDAIAIATLGDSDELLLGEQVIAIGNALGYGQSVTVGYISALDREIMTEDGDHRKFIQTDAAINPGNSGGALLNAAGEVIGINSNKIGGTAVEGMGYAIPITTASPIIAELMEKQTRYKVSDAERGYIGITRQDVTEDISLMYGMPKGVYILSVLEGSAADKAGIVKGDVITKFDGNKITCDDDLMAALQYCAVGDEVKITIMRFERGEYVEHEMDLVLGERPTERRR